ncbi:MAG: DUF2993 domain-containing protein [Cyanobacteria bacterium P01_E01_bin.6]
MPDLSQEPFPETSSTASTGSRLITRLLKPAVRLWLNSQIEHAQHLDVTLTGSDRQILGGYLPGAHVVAQDVVYRGLRLSSIDVAAQGIRTNGLRVLRGDAFQLLEPLPIDVHVMLSEADLHQSLAAPLFANAIEELLQRIVAHCMDWSDRRHADDGQDVHLSDLSITLRSNRLQLSGPLITGDRLVQLSLNTGLRLHTPNTLMFETPQFMLDGEPIEGRSLDKLNQFSIDLGETTTINAMQIENDCLSCQGQIVVMP